jgi:hypothetical protein
MRLIQVLRRFLLWLNYRNAAFVNTREELEAAIVRMPPRIVVDGDDWLRAHAAALIQAEQDGPVQVPEQAPAVLVVPPVGRIRDGTRRGGRPRTKEPLRLRGGMDIVLVAAAGVSAALIMEWLSFDQSWPRLIEGSHAANAGPHAAKAMPSAVHVSVWAERLAIPLLGIFALVALAWVVWQALGLGLPLKTSWRIEYRVPGRLVMARVRRRSA